MVKRPQNQSLLFSFISLSLAIEVPERSGWGFLEFLAGKKQRKAENGWRKA